MFFLLLLLVGTVLGTFPPYLCPTNSWSLVGTRCLLYKPSALGYLEAELDCEAQLPTFAGEAIPHLIDPRTTAENTWAYDQCKVNNAVFPSAWNVWAGPTTAPSTTYTPDYNLRNIRDTIGPKFVCVCAPPSSNANYPVWCIANSNTQLWGQALVETTNGGQCQPAGSNSLTSPNCPTGTVACKKPLANHPVSAASTGRGACWIGAGRNVNTVALSFKSNPGVSLSLVPLNYMEANLFADAAPGSQAQYTKSRGYGPVYAMPSCVGLWNYRGAPGAGNWVLDYCAKPMPYVCVSDARCPGGFYKNKMFQVSGTGTVTQASCSRCPAGQYRALEDIQSSCTDCPQGYFGALTDVRNTTKCSGSCRTGYWCATSAKEETPCDKGFYGVPTVPGGPGWSSSLEGCAPCPAGYFCPNEGSVLSNAQKCSAGYCGYPQQFSNTCSRTCMPGHYCPVNEANACPGRQCGDGYLVGYPKGTNAYCPDFSLVPLAVPLGKYGTGESNMTWSDVADCTPGFYCANGVRVPCAEGFYSSQGFSVAERTACKSCSSGYYCAPSPSAIEPGSTSPIQAYCSPNNALFPARYYCIKGVRAEILNDNFMTLPEDAPWNVRENVQPCPGNKVCQNGLAYDRLVWSNCPSTGRYVELAELHSQRLTGLSVTAVFQGGINPSDYNLDYRVLSQSYANPQDLLDSKPALCKLGKTSNDGIFDIDLPTGEIALKRYSPDPRNATKALQFEICEPITNVQYRIEVQASARHKTLAIQANLTCTVFFNVLDANDAPVFPLSSYNRFIAENVKENTPASRCSGVLATVGCPNEVAGDNEVAALDEDSFGQGDLVYSFIGADSPPHNKLKINSCTGLISQSGGEPLKFSDPLIPLYNSNFKRLQYTVLVKDDGNGNPGLVKNATTTVYVYIQNVNDPPTFAAGQSAIAFWVPESTLAKRAPPGTLVTPNTLVVLDDDPQDTYTLHLIRNDGSAFEIVNNQLRTTFDGSQTINFESTKKSYSLDIEARDNGVPSLSAFITITVQVANANDPPQLETGAFFYILETAMANDPVCRGDEFTRCANPADSIHRVSSFDPDQVELDVTSFALTKNPGNKFGINSLTGQIYLLQSNSLDFEDTNTNTTGGTGRGYYLEVTAFSSGAGVVTQPSLPTRIENSSQGVFVYVVDMNENPQFTTSNSTSFFIVETWPVGVVVDTIDIHAMDPDNADEFLKGVLATKQTLSFSIVANPSDPNDGEPFFTVSTNALDNTKARIVVRKALDRETRSFHNLLLKVVDSGFPQGVSYRNYRVELINVNEPPSFASQTFSFSMFENVSYETNVTVPGASSVMATDPDQGGNVGLVYSVIGGDGFTHFAIRPLAPGLGFALYKKANALLDFETKSSYTLRILVTDTLGFSSSIGKSCILDQGMSIGCNEGAVCEQSRCKQICPSYINGTGTFVAPRVNTYFCQDLTGVNNLQLVQPVFRETAETLVTVTIGNANDAPYISDRVLIDTAPNYVSNFLCSVQGTVQYQLISSNAQVAIKQLVVWDDDVPNPGPWAGPFSFAMNGGLIWNNFTLNPTTGSVTFPSCLPAECLAKYYQGQSFTGSVRVTDSAGLFSSCKITVNLTDANTFPDLGLDRQLPGVPENVDFTYDEQGMGLGVLVFPGFTRAEMVAIDSDIELNDRLVFSSSFSAFFSLNSTNAAIRLKQASDYESLVAAGFVRTYLVSVTDKQGASDVIQFTIPILDVNEAPYWNTALMNEQGRYVLVKPENFNGVLADLTSQTFDPDTESANVTWRTTTISLFSNDPLCDLACLPVEIFSGTQLRVKPSRVLDFEAARNSWEFVLRVRDGGGLYSDLLTTLSLTNVNEPPTFTGVANRTVPEGNGGPLGQHLLDMREFVSDPDYSDVLTFNLTGGNLGNVFEIVNGQLRIAKNQILDYEDISEYTLGLNVSDASGLFALGQVKIFVTNVNDVSVTSIVLQSQPFLSCTNAPSTVVITGSNFGMKLNVPSATVVVKYKRSTGGAAAPTFTATSCVLTQSNTELTCQLSQGGAGLNFLFDVEVTVPGTQISNNAVRGVPTVLSFPEPTLTSVSGATLMSTSGGATIDLYGSCLGTPADGLVFGSSVSNDTYVEFCTFESCVNLANCASVSQSRITCTASIPPGGLGYSVNFKVRVARQTSLLSVVNSAYQIPAVTSLSLTSLKTTGDMAVPLVITGTNFGSLNRVPEVARLWYNDTVSGKNKSFALLGCFVSQAFVKVTCTSSAPGFGQNVFVQLSFGNQLSNGYGPPTLSFERPVVTKIVSTGNVASPSKGGLLITISGFNFGPVCGKPGVSFERDGAENCDFVRTSYSRGSVRASPPYDVLVYRPTYCAIFSPESIICATVPGTGFNHTWQVTVGGQTALPNLNYTTNYSSPTVGAYENLGSVDATTRGGQFVDIRGNHFGPSNGALIMAKYGNSDVNETEFTATNCTVFVEHEVVRCVTSMGAGDGLEWRITVDDQLSRSELSDYGIPTISSIRLGASMATNLNADGGQMVNISGNNFGPPVVVSIPFLQQVIMGPSSNPSLYDLTSSCHVVSHENMICRMVSGVGTDLRWRVTVRGLSSVDTSNARSSYAPAALQQMSFSTSRTNGGSNPPLRLTVTNLPFCDSTVRIRIGFGTRFVDSFVVKVLPEPANPVELTDVCATPDQLATIGTTTRYLDFAVPEMIGEQSVPVFIRVESAVFSGGFQDTAALTMTYQLPVIQDVFAEPGETGESIKVTLAGINFCKSELCCTTYLDGRALLASEVIQHDHNVVIFSASAPGSVYIQCPGGRTLTKDFSSRNPFVYGAVKVDGFQRLDAARFLTVGQSEDIYVFGLYTSASVQLFIENVEVTPLAVISFECQTAGAGFVPDTLESVLSLITPGQQCVRIQGKVPPGQGLLNSVMIQVGSLKSRVDDVRFEYLRYAAPGITQLSPSFSTLHPTSGNALQLLTVTGTNFGLSGEVEFGAFEGTRHRIFCSSATPGVTWSQTSVSCPVPAGEGSSLTVRVLVGGQYSLVTPLNTLKYQRPVITGYVIVNSNSLFADTEGGQILDIQGSNFGRNYNSLAIATSPGYASDIKLGLYASCALLNSTHTSILCRIPEGDGGGIALTVLAQNELPYVSSPILFSYGIPVIYSLSPNMSSTSGKDANGTRQILEVRGKNFGATDTKLEFTTNSGEVLFLLGDRRPRDFVNTFLFASHTRLLVYLPKSVGKDINVTVTASKLVNQGGPRFSYFAPSIGGVGIVTTTPSSRRRLADFEPKIDNIQWSSYGFGNCVPMKPLPLKNRTSSELLAYRVQLDITNTGAFTRSITLHQFPNFTSIEPTSCTGLNQISLTVQTGTFRDGGEHPNMGCVRMFVQQITSQTGPELSIFPNVPEAAGLYFMSDKKDMFQSLPSFASIDDLLARSDHVEFPFLDTRTATLTTTLVDSLQSVPTSGCEKGYWEEIGDYQDRLDQSTTFAVLPRKCLKPVILGVTGDDFGTDCFPMNSNCMLFVSLVDMVSGRQYEASTTSNEGNHELLCTTCTRTDTYLTFAVPYGAGRNLFVNVTVGGQTTVKGPFIHYLPPTVEYLAPGTLNTGNSFLNANGLENAQVIGENLGYTNTSLSILFNGKPCERAKWISGTMDKDGQSSLECVTQRDVVGAKSVFVCVGNQAKFSRVDKLQVDVNQLQYGQSVQAWNTTTTPLAEFTDLIRSQAFSRCPNKYYGRLGELCLPCPVGGNCFPGFALPLAQKEFFVLDIPSTSDRALMGACAPERLFPNKTYPDQVLFETCSQVVKCMPGDSCLGKNQCAQGYEYQLHRCNLKRNNTDSDNSCRVHFDANTLQYRGVDSDCQPNTASGAACSHEHPEECSVCQISWPELGSISSGPIGTCTCQLPQRCALCTAMEYYRLNNECIKCPDNPALVFSLFVLAGFAVILLAYYLQKKKINLAFLSIGVDYFQILAILSTTNIPWPPLIRQIFQLFFIFLASIDIAAPECLVPNLEFSVKFYLTELMPVLVLFILLTIHFSYTFVKLYRFGKQAKWLSHVSRLVGVFVLFMYILYLSLTKKALDVFNCNPLDPDDGYSYTTFSSLSCDGGGLCRCGDPGGVQDSLVAPAIAFLLLYTFGFPLTVFVIVTKYKEQIREDQYLRANELGNRRETNPRAYEIRKRYQLMYMHFKPKYCFWMLSILGRKFGVAFAGLMFRGNPSFQLAVILIVLFISFTLQVSIRPYMSPGEFPVVVKELNDNSKMADEDLETYARDREMFRKVGECMRIQAELARKEKMHRHKMGAGFWEESKVAAREHDRRSATEKYFFDLNAVEATLLGCCIIIALSGIMFESGRFQSRVDLYWQGDLVVALVFVVLFGSLFYYALVFINELWPHCFARYCGRLFLRYQHDGISQEDLDRMKDNELRLDANPLFAATGPIGDKSKSLMKEIDTSKQALALAKRQNDELKKLKAELEAQGAGTTVSNPLALMEFSSTFNKH